MIDYIKKQIFLGLVCCLFCTCFINAVNANSVSSCSLNGDGCVKASRDVYHILTPERQKKLDELIQEFNKKVQPLREKILAKKIELRTISKSNNPDRKIIQELAQEIAKLHTGLTEEYNKMYTKLEKELGIRGRHIFKEDRMMKNNNCDGPCVGKFENTEESHSPVKVKKKSSKK